MNEKCIVHIPIMTESNNCIKCFPNYLLMNQKDCLYSPKSYCQTFFSLLLYLSQLLWVVYCSAVFYSSHMLKIKCTAVRERMLGLLFISSLFPYAQFISLLIFINVLLLSLFLVPSHYPSNRIMSFHCPFFLICLLSLP